LKILGLDVGDKTIGVAVSDGLLLTAQGRTTIFRQSIKKDIDQLIDIIKNDNITKIVVGLPKNMDNSLGRQVEKTKKFIEKLEKKIRYTDRLETHDIEIIYWDERLSSLAAENILIEGDVSRKKRKDVIDKLAAAIILQSYLDSLTNEQKEV
jgi:putative Holliday junction resolvase